METRSDRAKSKVPKASPLYGEKAADRDELCWVQLRRDLDDSAMGKTRRMAGSGQRNGDVYSSESAALNALLHYQRRGEVSEDLEAIRVMGFWYWLWCRTGCYRGFMRLAHRFNWHHMEKMPIIDWNRQQIWCQWCGARYVYVIDTQAEIRAAADRLWSTNNTGGES